VVAMRQSRITFEECARRILQRELGRPVVLHDDGRRPGLYDLRVGDETAPDIAIECVGAVDSARVETWNIGPAQGPLALNVAGDWDVVLRPNARVKEIKKGLEKALQDCELAHVTGFTPVDWWLERQNPRIYAVLEALRIDSIACFRESGTGQVHLGMTGTGGAVDPYGSAVPGWIEEFLNAPDPRDVIRKLELSGAVRRHVFVGVAFVGVPWPVESYLGTRTDHAPTGSPALPSCVDAVWIRHGRRGLHWDGSSWRLFDAIVPTA
jgi:hypothetical protein